VRDVPAEEGEVDVDIIGDIDSEDGDPRLLGQHGQTSQKPGTEESQVQSEPGGLAARTGGGRGGVPGARPPQ